MIWSCFWGGGFGPLVIVEESVNQDVYIKILAEHFHPWFTKLHEKHDRDFIFQEYGARCHTGGYATWWKETHQIRGFSYWPPQSPDLNPIEHIWYTLGKLIDKRRSEIHNIGDLKMVLKEEWEKISHDLAEILVGSMHSRCLAVIAARGGPTKC
jgi:hypothetical protein